MSRANAEKKSELRSLKRLQSVVLRDRDLAPRINRLKRTRAWNNLGDLKRDLIGLWISERNALTKAVMTDIEAQRRESGASQVTKQELLKRKI